MGDGAESLGFGLDDGERLAFPDVAEGDVDRQREVMNGGGLAGTCENQGLVAAGLEIGDEGFDPGKGLFVFDCIDALGERQSEFAGDLPGDVEDLAWGHTQAVVRHAAGERIGGLHGVEAVHFRRVRLVIVGLAFRLAAIEERSHRALRIGSGEIAVESENAVRLREISHGFHSVAEREGGVAGEGFVLIELRGGKLPGDFLGQAGAGRAVIRAEEETDFRRLVGGERGDGGIQVGALGGLCRI